MEVAEAMAVAMVVADVAMTVAMIVAVVARAVANWQCINHVHQKPATQCIIDCRTAI